MKKLILFSLSLCLILLTFSCRKLGDEQPAKNQILGIWERQNTSGAPFIYDFNNGGVLKVTANGQTEQYAYSITYENYDDPNSEDNKQDIIRIAGEKYILKFQDAAHMNWSKPSTSFTPIYFVRQK